MKIPARITVKEIVSSRYGERAASERHRRPSSWDLRVDGIDKVRSTAGDLIPLWSAGGQSPPQPGWTILLNAGDAESGYRWTLYGLPPADATRSARECGENPYKKIDELMAKGACVQVAPREQ